MKLFVGLGNPGKEYQNTRHNVGFMTLDKLCDDLKIVCDKNKCKANYGIFFHNNEKIIVAKPQTFMNLSGEAVKSLLGFYQINVEDLTVVYDDMDLPLGKIRLRKKGSSGGHKGMSNIIDLLKTDNISRIRIGIGNNKLIEGKDYVLGKFSKEEKQILDDSLDKVVKALIYNLDHNFEETMSKFNQ